MTPSRETLANDWASARAALTNYATRIVLRKDVAEEIVQQAAVRLMEEEPIGVQIGLGAKAHDHQLAGLDQTIGGDAEDFICRTSKLE